MAIKWPHRLRLAFFIVMMSLASSVVLIIAGYLVHRKQVEGEYITTGKNITNTVADLLSGDTAEQYLNTQVRDLFFEDFTNFLKVLSKDHNLKYLYVVRFEQDGVRFVFDADDAANFPVPGHVQTWEKSFDNISQDEKQILFDGGDFPVKRNKTDVYGYTVVVFRPLLAPDGTVKKGYYAGCEFSMEHLIKDQHQYFGTLLVIAVILALFFSFVQWRVVRNLENNLLRAAREKERDDVELNIARNIQSHIMPFDFPPFPDRTDFDLWAQMHPAKKVAGDFYDFFFIDDENERLAIVIADVSGKGIAAAMFMVVAKTLLKNQLLSGTPLAHSACMVNKQLIVGNESNMFVTAWFGIYNTKTGVLDYVNAGHNLPLIKSGTNDGFCPLKNSASNMLLGVLLEAEYSSAQVVLEVNDVLFLYTDGITEAFNKTRKMYGDDRLLSNLNQRQNQNLEEIISGIKTDIDLFSTGVEQSDDITMLALKRNTR
ncbi:MAG: hypothetical protein Ta2G_16120 [Termitinemataceae bacterium]|nr:MAG: hypothetical protein Ta2G_16120 [Termitinemataceae bacterium]